MERLGLLELGRVTGALEHFEPRAGNPLAHRRPVLGRARPSWRPWMMRVGIVISPRRSSVREPVFDRAASTAAWWDAMWAILR